MGLERQNRRARASRGGRSGGGTKSIDLHRNCRGAQVRQVRIEATQGIGSRNSRPRQQREMDEVLCLVVGARASSCGMRGNLGNWTDIFLGLEATSLPSNPSAVLRRPAARRFWKYSGFNLVQSASARSAWNRGYARCSSLFCLSLSADWINQVKSSGRFPDLPMGSAADRRVDDAGRADPAIRPAVLCARSMSEGFEV